METVQTTINLTPILVGLILLVGALVSLRLWPWIKAKTTKEQYANMQAVVRTLVYAAEQLYGANKGQEKLEYVCAELRKRGFEVDLSEIEAAVYQAFNFLDEHYFPVPNPDPAPQEEPEPLPEEQAEPEASEAPEAPENQSAPESERVTDQPPEDGGEE